MQNPRPANTTAAEYSTRTVFFGTCVVSCTRISTHCFSNGSSLVMTSCQKNKFKQIAYAKNEKNRC